MGDLQQALKLDTSAFHSIFFRSVDPTTNQLRDPSNDEQVERLANLIQHHTNEICKNGYKMVAPEERYRVGQSETMLLLKNVKKHRENRESN